jgi:hypothetical protein
MEGKTSMFVQQGITVLASEAVHVMSGFTSLLFSILALGMVLGGVSLRSANLRAGQIFIGTGCVVAAINATLFVAGGICL